MCLLSFLITQKKPCGLRIFQSWPDFIAPGTDAKRWSLDRPELPTARPAAADDPQNQPLVGPPARHHKIWYVS